MKESDLVFSTHAQTLLVTEFFVKGKSAGA